MFTGLIREVGRLRSMTSRAGVTRLDIEAPHSAAAAGAGDSIAVNGICLTVTAVTGGVLRFEAVAETRRLTTLKHWRRGDRLHLEPALRAGDPLDGHHVQGHVDGTGTVASVKKAGRGLLVTVDLPRELAAYLTPKGSVALDGVSLTVDEGPFDRRFTVSLIPHTLAVTALGRLRAGRPVNLEMDVLVKAARGAGTDRPAMDRPDSTLERLLARGFGRRRSKTTG